MPSTLNSYHRTAAQGATDDIPLQLVQHPPGSTLDISDGGPPLSSSRCGAPEHAGLSTEHNSPVSWHRPQDIGNQPPSRQQSGSPSVILQCVALPQRRPLKRLIVHLIYPVSSIIIMLIVLSLSGTILKSPEQPDLTEWAVCGDQLGGLACIWLALLVIFCGLRYRGFILERQIRHQYPQDLYTTWISPGPLSYLLPQPTAKRNSGAASAQPRDNRMSLPPLPQTQDYSSWMFIFLLLSLVWSLATIALLGKSFECLDSSPHIWRLLFAIVCLHSFVLLVIAFLWFIKFFHSLRSSR